MYRIFEPTKYRIFEPKREHSPRLVESELAPSDRALAPSDRRLATNSHVRRVFLAAMTRVRNLSVLALMSTAAMVMFALGMSWSGLGVLGVGTVLYASAVTRDAVSEKFVAQLLSLETEEEEEEEEREPGMLCDGNQAAVPLYGLEENMRIAYRGILSQRTQLQERIDACPSALQPSLSEGNAICTTLLAHTERLVLRGQRLHSYLEFTRLPDLQRGVPLFEVQSESSTDLMARKIYEQVVTARKQHIQTHIEVEGLYVRVLAQLLLIETTLAGTIARVVKITAVDDEQSSTTADEVTQELETLLSEVAIFESSLDEVSQFRTSTPQPVAER